MTAVYDATARRFDLRVPVLFKGARGRGKGIIWDMSLTGARIEIASSRVRPGSQIHMKFSYSDESKPIVASAEVVRPTDTGFAVRFKNPSQSFLEQLGAALPKHSSVPRPVG